MQDLLSQDEIDALLDSVSAGEVDDTARTEQVGARAYDLASQQHVVRGRMSGLEAINQRFARQTRGNLAKLLKRDVEVSASGIRSQKYGEYLHSLYVPTSLNLVRFNPLRGTGLVVLDARLVFRLVDHFFGGCGLHTKVEGRDFTPAELRVVEVVLQQAFADLSDAWRSVTNLQCEVIGSEVNPAMASIVGSSDMVVVNSFYVDLDGGGGELHLVFPQVMLDPLRDLLEASVRGNTEESDRSWHDSLHKQVMDAEVEIRCRVAERELSLRDVATWQVGDVISVDMRNGSVLMANGKPVFRAKLGVSHGNLALQVLGKL